MGKKYQVVIHAGKRLVTRSHHESTMNEHLEMNGKQASSSRWEIIKPASTVHFRKRHPFGITSFTIKSLASNAHAIVDAIISKHAYR